MNTAANNSETAAKIAELMGDYSGVMGTRPMATSIFGDDHYTTQASAQLHLIAKLFHLSGETDGESTNIADPIMAYALDGVATLLDLGQLLETGANHRRAARTKPGPQAAAA